MKINGLLILMCLVVAACASQRRTVRDVPKAPPEAVTELKENPKPAIEQKIPIAPTPPGRKLGANSSGRSR